MSIIFMRDHLRSDSVVAEELAFVEHTLQNATQALFGRQGEQSTLSLTWTCESATLSMTHQTSLKT